MERRGSTRRPDVPLVVVSIRKCGTHLVKSLLTEVGYLLHGDVEATVTESDHLRGDRLMQVLAAVYDEAELAKLMASEDETQVSAAVAEALHAYYAAWRAWMGSPRPLLQDATSPSYHLALRLAGTPDRGEFLDQPGDLAWLLHELDPRAAHPAFLGRWLSTGQPRLLLVARDPRDALVSMVRFLAADGPDDQVGQLPEHRLYRQILRGATSLERRLDIALTDPGFPGLQGFTSALWLRNHPDVVQLRFEDLVGPRGGGTQERQVRAVRSFLEACGVPADPHALLRRLDERRSFTFRQGRIGSHQQVFTPRQHQLFERYHGHLLEAYG